MVELGEVELEDGRAVHRAGRLDVDALGRRSLRRRSLVALELRSAERDARALR